MKKKLNLLFFLTIFLHGCGFEPLLSSKNIDNTQLVSIEIINFKNYSDLNNLFLRKFRYFQKGEENLKKFNIDLDIDETKKIISKNKLGDPETFNIEIIANISILNTENNILNSRTIRKNKNYNNLNNKFDLKQEENIIKNNIVDEIVDEILNTMFSM
jgi:outer membrane lipopolysaccharide assembly protein LptE/RlpB